MKKKREKKVVKGKGEKEPRQNVKDKTIYYHGNSNQ